MQQLEDKGVTPGTRARERKSMQDAQNFCRKTSFPLLRPPPKAERKEQQTEPKMNMWVRV